jgi:hypothetical protein
MQGRFLDNRYFRVVQSQTESDFDYQIVRPLDHPMVLFSKVDGSPLAALHFRTQNNHVQNDNNGKRGRALITKRPYNSEYKCDFQGLVDCDDQEFELVISNLSHQGHINFNLLKTDSKVDTVNPGGLNEINELRPGESYAVQCDQTDNKVLVLSTIKNETTGEKTTVKEDEASGNKPTGSYFFLSVVPQIDCPELVAQFAETEWACVDVFCRRLPKAAPVHHEVYRGIPEVLHGYGGAVPAVGHVGLEAHVQRAKLHPKSFRGEGERERITEVNAIHVDDIVPHSAEVRWEGEEEEEGDFGGGGCLFGGGVDFDDDGWDAPPSPTVPTLSRASEASVSVPAPKTKKDSKDQSAEIVQTSYASRIRGGDRTVHVQGYQTSIEYSYDVASAPCVIGLSVSDRLQFCPEPENSYLVELGQELITDMIKNAAKEFLEKISKVYKSDTCGVCLEGEEQDNPVDCIFYQCGHQCCHYECSQPLSSCPMCRTHITARVPLGDQETVTVPEEQQMVEMEA